MGKSRFLPFSRTTSAVAALLGMAVAFALAASTSPTAVGGAVFTLWIAWLAVEFGVLGGVAGAVAAAGLFLTATSLSEHDFDGALLLSRGLPFLGIGIAIGAIGERLHITELEHKTLLEQLPFATYVEPLDGNGTTYVSPQIEALTGYPAERWVGPDSIYSDALHPDDRDAVLEAQRQARAAREDLSLDYRFIRADGAPVWVNERSVVLRGPRGGWRRQGFVVDASREKESERIQRRLIAELQVLIDATLDGICLTDREGNAQVVNRTLRRLTRELELPGGLPVHEALIAVADQFTEPETFRRRMRELAAQPEVPSRDEFEHKESGRVFMGFTHPVVDEREFIARVWTLRDVTEDRELTRLREEFLATVSHELRTPLTSISGFLELLGERAQNLGETERRYLATVDRNVARLRTLVDGLLLMRQVGAHSFSIERARLDLAEVVAEAVEAAGPQAVARNVELALEARGAVPLDGDRARLAQVADNLIGNAVKFTLPGGQVQVDVEAADGRGILVVTDDGVGIPAAHRPRLFDPFFRAGSATEQQIPGTGLGLSIVKAIVDAHGGTIGVESEPGRGSTFRVELPGL